MFCLNEVWNSPPWIDSAPCCGTASRRPCVSLCTQSSAVVMSPYCWLLREIRHYRAPLEGSTTWGEQLSNLFSFIGFPAFSCSISKSPLNSSVVSPVMKISSATRNSGFAISWIHCISVSCQPFASSGCEIAQALITGRRNRDFTGVWYRGIL